MIYMFIIVRCDSSIKSNSFWGMLSGILILLGYMDRASAEPQDLKNEPQEEQYRVIMVPLFTAILGEILEHFLHSVFAGKRATYLLSIIRPRRLQSYPQSAREQLPCISS